MWLHSQLLSGPGAEVTTIKLLQQSGHGVAVYHAIQKDLVDALFVVLNVLNLCVLLLLLRHASTCLPPPSAVYNKKQHE